MKSVLISIQPKWCELISSGKKTVEVRKTKPKLETPFKVYIYCTYGEGLIKANDEVLPNHLMEQKVSKHKIWGNCCNGKVIGEFVCDFITNYEAELWDDETFERIQEFYEPEDFNEYGEYEYQTLADNSDDFWKVQHLCKVSCVSIEELRKYLGLGIHKFYGWHISDLVIYDEPKELSGFSFPHYRDCDIDCKKRKFGFPVEVTGGIEYDCDRRVKRPPQSWCYVESSGDQHDL
jgi:ASC-1-like (ASCH) protein